MPNPFLNKFIRNVLTVPAVELNTANAIYFINRTHPFSNQLSHSRITALFEEYKSGVFTTRIDSGDMDLCWRLVVAYIIALEYYNAYKTNEEIVRELTGGLLEFYDRIDINVPLFEQVLQFKINHWLGEDGEQRFFDHFISKRRLSFPPKMFYDPAKAENVLKDLRVSTVFSQAYRDFEVKGLAIPGAERAANATLYHWSDRLIEFIIKGVNS